VLSLSHLVSYFCYKLNLHSPHSQPRWTPEPFNNVLNAHGLVFNPRLLLSTVLWVQAYRISLSIHSLSVLPLLAVSKPLSLGTHLSLSLYLGFSVSLC
jgi:hypothetical protein